MNYALAFATTDAQSIWGAGGPTEIRGGDTIVHTYSAAYSPVDYSDFLGNYASMRLSAGVTPGFAYSYEVDPGTYTSNLRYSASIDVPSSAPDIGGDFALSGVSDLVGGLFETTSPTIKAAVDLMLGVDLDLALKVGNNSIFGDIRLINSTFNIVDEPAVPSNLITIDGLEVTLFKDFLDAFSGLSDASGNAALAVTDFLYDQLYTFDLGEVNVALNAVAPTGAGVTVTYDNLTASFGRNGVSTEVADLGVNIPVVDTSTGPDGDAFDSRGEDDFFDVDADLDALIPVLPVGDVSLGTNVAELTLTGYDVDFGPDINLYQEFEFLPELYVGFETDKAVSVDGELVRSFKVALDDLASLTLSLDDATTFTPTFSVGGTLRSETGFAFDVDFTIEGLSAAVRLGFATLSTPSLFSGSLPFDIADLSLFDEIFSVAGFNAVEDSAFTIVPQIPVTDGDDDQLGTTAGDEVDALRGNDTIRGLLGDDTIEGSGGDDRLVGDKGFDWLDGGSGFDNLIGGNQADTLVGGNGQDTLLGGEGRDELFGGIGRDRLNGGEAADIIDGGEFDDILIGGGGKDRFVLHVDGGRDRVMDFELNERLDVSDFDLTFRELDVFDRRGNTVVLGDGGLEVVLVGFDVDDLSGKHFVF
ncbi:hypothetical protein DLJ53_27150 [Acuticoccus sediminis]|uniref:Hemolysin-type calcium-binding repeat-containing protein n=2 Tax=Acuticoccus sediminis TaxID=2184697 RepID=A0A8B2NJC2_9HYPH|nr:hypothetical protein DLJ53_27150 [Acuticoccus sediminis]